MKASTSNQISLVTSKQPVSISSKAYTDRCLVKERSGTRQLVIVFWILASVVGGFQAWAHRDWMFGDGISYLDVGEAYLGGTWSTAINGYWSPLYSWILGAMLSILKTPPLGDFALMHLANFLIFLCSLGSFHFYLMGLIDYQRVRTATNSEDRVATLPDWGWIVLGYTLFLWSALNLITITVTSPDMLVATFVYLASGMLIRIRMGYASRPMFALFGVVLGLGYLAKAVMFPLAFLFLAVSLFCIGSFRKAFPRMLIALAVFLLIGGSFIFALSLNKGRFTFGDSYKLIYAWYGNGVTLIHWQGEGFESGAPKHPTRKVLQSPAIYEFRTPFRVTYPPWYDPSYWYDGVKIHFDLKWRLGALLSSALEFRNLLRFLVVGLIGLYFAGFRTSLLMKRTLRISFLLIPAIAALGMYSMMSWSGRYISPFVVILGTGILSVMLSFELSVSRKTLAYALIATLVVVLSIKIGRYMAPDVYSVVKEMMGEENVSVHRRFARGLMRLGVRPGDDVAFIGYFDEAYGVRLARLYVVAEMPGSPPQITSDYWAASDVQKCQIATTFANVGSKFIITMGAPSSASSLGWEKLGDTNYYLYRLSPGHRECSEAKGFSTPTPLSKRAPA